jgi:[histone H3]-trimethyl-L-lysine4 demethylase
MLIFAGTRANLNYLDQLAKFHKQRSGTTLNRFPSVDKRPLDLYKLKKFVEDKGGFDNVCRGKRWAEIGRDLGYSGKIMSSLSTSLKNSYMKWLMPYEEWLKQNKPSVLQQQERDHGGPYTPSPGHTPAKSTNQSPAPLVNTAPALKASMALSATLQDPPKQEMIETPPPRPSGFTAVNSGFTAVNAPPPIGFSAINVTNGSTNGNVTPNSGVVTPDPRIQPNGSEPEIPASNGIYSTMKRQHSAEDSSANDDDPSGRRSKRLKKENNTPTVTGSHMIQPRIPGPAPMATVPRDRSNDKPGDCDVCGKGAIAGPTLVCDSCDVAYHQSCLELPSKSQGDSDWHCPRCLVGTGEFGFEEGGIYSLKGFQEKALRFKERHFQKKWTMDPVTKRFGVPEEEVELEFWRLTESLTETVEVEYGADLHSTTHGSGFPTIERDPFSEYSTDPWNLNVMPLEKDSLFRHIKTDISGMTVPWLYVGMCFSTFCWHNEDHYTYSANYQHFGDTKTWYGIPSGSAERFEDAMREAVPELFEQQPDLLFQLVTLLQPDKLRKANVQVYALDQRAGEFVITFPQAYHAGFNHGFNLNEAVNFAPSDWEPFGAAAVERLQVFRRQPVFSHEELLFSAVTRDHSIKTAKWLSTALRRVMDHETRIRGEFNEEFKAIRSQFANGAADDTVGPDGHPPFIKDAKDHADEETVCAFCKAYGFLSRFSCRVNNKVLCLMHAGKFDCCNLSLEDRLLMKDGNHELQYRLTNSELEAVVQKVMDTAKTPDVWHEKLDTFLDEGPKPTLRSLRAIVAEGEKIDATWPLPELHDLKTFVTKCNAWVEEATSYIARKPNRRKSESRYRGPEEGKKKATEKNNLRNPENVKRLLQAAEDLSFECPELDKLQERYDNINEFQRRARTALNLPHASGPDLEALIEEGHDLDMDLPEMSSLEKQARTVQWFAEAQGQSEKMGHGTSLSLDEVKEFIERGKSLDIADNNEFMNYFRNQVEQGEFWESKAQQVMSVENVNFQQLDALFKQASRLPVSRTTLSQIDEMLKKQREAEEIVMIIYEKTKDIDCRKRPTYKAVKETMDRLQTLNIKPPGTLDLEREQKRHEDWMRRGKKLFGKANAPLHILMQHMQYVFERNENCLDLTDQPRMPVEPASREASPAPNYADGSSSSSNVFCVCRKPESGMMIECELCHEW